MNNHKKDASNTWRKANNNPLESSDIQDTILKIKSKPAAVKSIYYAANVLTCLSQGVYSITEISDVCKLNKATVHRILKALVDSNLAIQDPIKRQYYLGHSISRIAASPYTSHEYLMICGYKPMRHLSDVTQETVFVNILLGLQYINMHEIPSKHDLRVAEVTRKTGHVPAGASSRVLLSQLNNKELNIAMQYMDLQLPNGKIISEEDLRSDIMKIHQTGYCLTAGEKISGCICISAPVTNYFLPAALSIIGPESRIRPRIDEFIAEVKQAASLVSENVAKSISE